ncbi:hypothetical protein F9278_20640 [Streptomyces phaeolivaceus]|uniref:Uncharacterized protein n=1 Tax=Streptomyces phaeolivaceus TaxID=2653200 RepID=A0A5P8K5Z5_9ACTN|nr:hypothetical protein F9278_20640 [Streptomyces phaeolivaceus]
MAWRDSFGRGWALGGCVVGCGSGGASRAVPRAPKRSGPCGPEKHGAQPLLFRGAGNCASNPHAPAPDNAPPPPRHPPHPPGTPPPPRHPPTPPAPPAPSPTRASRRRPLAWPYGR